MERRSSRAAHASPGAARAGSRPAWGETPEVELERARLVYRGSLEAVRAWRTFSPGAGRHDAACWSMLGSLFAEPGLSRTVLVDRIVEYAGISRSTAERVRPRSARRRLHHRPPGKAISYFVSVI